MDIGRDPLTGKRRQKWTGGFATRQAAEQALATALADRANGIAEPSRLTLGAYVAQWLPGHTLTLKPTTAKSYRELLTWTPTSPPTFWSTSSGTTDRA